MHVSAALSLLALLPLAAPIAAQAEGSLDRLSCRVRQIEPADDWTLLVRVEVENRNAVTAEVAEFVVRTPDGERRVRRFPYPEAGRHGRGAPARGAQDYWLRVRLPDSRAPRLRVEVGIGAAVFHDRPVPDAPPVTLGRIEHRDVEEGGHRFQIATIETHNALDRPVDALLLVRLRKPQDSRWLCPVHIEPGDGEVTIDGLRTEMVWESATSKLFGLELRSAEVVDWTGVQPVTDAPIVDAFAAAWTAWRRWESPPAGLGGRFRLRQRTVQDGQGVTSEIRKAGRFTILADGSARVEVETVEGTADRRPPTSTFELAFRDLLRPSFDQLRADPGVEAFDGRRVRLPRGRERPEYGNVFEVDDGRIVGATVDDGVDRLRWAHEIQALGAGYVVSGRRLWQKALGEHLIEQRAYTTVADGVVVPTRLARMETYGGLFNEYELLLADFGFGAGADLTPAAPDGPSTAALRALWDGPGRHPDEPVDLVAHLEVDHRNTDGVWAGVRKVSGTLRIRGYRGFRMGDSGWDEVEFEPDDAALSPNVRAALHSAVYDRLILWAGRDLAGRAAFDRVFRGASITETAPGTFAIEGGGASRAVAQDGVLREVDFVGGRALRATWRKVGDHLVPARVQNGDEVLEARWRDVGGVPFPSRLRFERVFGADWGPETLEFSKVRIGR
jgi:hypothetical protein